MTNKTIYTKAISRLVIFDMDHTLTHESTTDSWYHFLGDKKMINATERIRNRHEINNNYLNDRISVIDYFQQQFYELKGLSKNDVNLLIKEWALTGGLNSIYNQSFKLVQTHLNENDHCILISTSFEKIASAIAKKLKISYSIGTYAEFDNNLLATGRQVGTASFSTGKVICLEEHLKSLNKTIKDFKEIWVYSDSIHDLPLFNIATHPIATNPSPKLKMLAKEKNWKVIQLK